MTPEKWQAAMLALATTLAIAIPAALAMKRLKADGMTYLRAGLILLAAYVLAIVFFDLRYVEAPLWFGARAALMVVGASFLGVAVARSRA